MLSKRLAPRRRPKNSLHYHEIVIDDTPSPSICWKPVLLPSKSSLVIAASAPRPSISASPLPRCVRPRVRSICTRHWLALSRRTPRLLERRKMDRPQFEVADVFRCYGADYRLQNGASMSNAQHRVMTAIEVCRTAVLGGHLEQCDQCGHQRNAFNSCGESALPKMPIARPGSMAPGSSSRTFKHRILPRGLYRAGTDCHHLLSE